MSSVDVMCHQQGSVVAEVVLSGWEGKEGEGRRSAQVLAEELVGQVNGRGGKFTKRPLGRLAQKAEVHGYIEGPVCDAVRSSQQCLLDMHSKAIEASESKHEAMQENLGDVEGAAKREKDRHMETCRRAVSRMMQIQLARAWEGYADAVMQKRERRETCQRVVRRMLHTHLAAAFDW